MSALRGNATTSGRLSLSGSNETVMWCMNSHGGPWELENQVVSA